MSFDEQIVNGSFEAGTFSPWTASNAVLTSQFSHSGLFAAQLAGGTANAYIFQFVPVDQENRLMFVVSLARVGPLPSPMVSIIISYFDADFNFLGQGLITNIPAGHLPDVNENNWLEVYKTTEQAPLEAIQALVFISNLSQAGTADIVIDDVSLVRTFLLEPETEIPVSINRIYVANQYSNNISVIDGNNNTVIATVTVGSSPYAAAVYP